LNKKAVGEPLKRRYKEAEERPAAFEEMGRSLQLIKKALHQFAEKDEKYNHLDQADVDRVVKLVEERSKWFEDKLNLTNKMNKCEDPVVLVSQIKFEKDVSSTFWLKSGFLKESFIDLILLQTMDKTAWTILNKPKPKVEVPKVEEPKVEESAQSEQKPTPSPQSADKKPSDHGMDVD